MSKVTSGYEYDHQLPSHPYINKNTIYSSLEDDGELNNPKSQAASRQGIPSHGQSSRVQSVDKNPDRAAYYLAKSAHP